jgi:hypothetical protein
MNKIKASIIAIAITLFVSEANAQIQKPKIDPQVYVDALSRFNLEDLCADTVLLTQIGK